MKKMCWYYILELVKDWVPVVTGGCALAIAAYTAYLNLFSNKIKFVEKSIYAAHAGAYGREDSYNRDRNSG